MPLVIEVTTTCGCQDSARELAGKLIDHRLAACVQISGPIESMYRWEEKVQREPEWSCTIKSSVKVRHKLIEFIEAHHAYAIPQILVAEITASDRYAAWVESEIDHRDSV
ncbi:MAG: divalent-cation tolerance protein CutA [Pirellulaceae bacterium]|nr:divalent-cation tolerance protein CutA [Pirellulaceae bacterium]